MKSIYIYGASGHGLVVAEIASACGYSDIVFIDDGKNQYLSFEEIKKNHTIPIALGVGINSVRAKLFEKAKECGFQIATLIHPGATISPSAVIREGTVVMPGVTVNAKALIENGVILNTGCIVEHECIIDEFAHISPNVALAGAVKIGKYTHIGIGSSVIQGIIIGENSVIGAGSTIVRDIGSGKKAYGNPCREIEDMR